MDVNHRVVRLVVVVNVHTLHNSTTEYYFSGNSFNKSSSTCLFFGGLC